MIKMKNSTEDINMSKMNLLHLKPVVGINVGDVHFCRMDVLQLYISAKNKWKLCHGLLENIMDVNLFKC